MKLATLQRQFSKALHYQISGQECDITGGQFSADERIQVYRNNFIISLSEILSATYPMLEALLGQECFAQVARQHVLSHPLQEGNVVHYGEGLADTLMQFGQVMAQAPYSREVARFEWVIDLARQAQYEHRTNKQQQPLPQLAQVTQAHHPRVVLQLCSGCKSFASDYAVFDLFAAMQHQQFEQLNLNQPQQGAISIQPSGTARCLKLTTDAFRLLRRIEQRQSLGEIPSELLKQLDQMLTLGLVDGFILRTD
ncbi:DNA-binding domain-containing protein [Vibrio sp. CAU 1672]|uniref:HvfC/BufC N-terminal domain-containing protein n=1 Tax=Vibrio sp. CAU 1672 TaxID=3032594 RepID=UPI0023DBF630|nr:DNA-binding domain-containing protein [Vibrio sp. CAU 1672]MDF2155814.1 DNA-binding domain-containing protein [Vibrio sp. CAU 1672]